MLNGGQNVKYHFRGPFGFYVRYQSGGADRDQTDDLVVANDALYQLSY